MQYKTVSIKNINNFRQGEKQPPAVSEKFPHSFFSALSFFLGGSMNKNCETCPDFVQRQQNADLIENAFGQSGVWDYKTCHTSCWQEESKRESANRIWQKNRYRKLHGLAVAR